MGYLGTPGEDLEILSTFDNKASLCSTEQNSAHFNVNESSKKRSGVEQKKGMNGVGGSNSANTLNVEDSYVLHVVVLHL